jgi:CheY-like chemotaxis protein
MMPVMDGPTACRALSEDSATAGIPIILLTARADHEERQGLSTLVAGVLSKPFEPVALSSAIEALLGASDHSGP